MHMQKKRPVSKTNPTGMPVIPQTSKRNRGGGRKERARKGNRMEKNADTLRTEGGLVYAENQAFWAI